MLEAPSAMFSPMSSEVDEALSQEGKTSTGNGPETIRQIETETVDYNDIGTIGGIEEDARVVP